MDEACGLVDRLVRLRALRAPPAVRRAAEAGRRWWALLSATLQRALASTLLGGRWLAPARPAAQGKPDLANVLALAGASGPGLGPSAPEESQRCRGPAGWPPTLAGQLTARLSGPGNAHVGWSDPLWLQACLHWGHWPRHLRIVPTRVSSVKKGLRRYCADDFIKPAQGVPRFIPNLHMG